MKIILNNREETFEKDTMNVAELLKAKNFTFKIITVKVNGSFVKKEDYETTLIIEGDDVAAIHLLTGG